MADFDDTQDHLPEALGRDEPQAARELVRRKLPRVLALAQRLLDNRGEAEDVAQETLLRAWQQASLWRQGEARFDTWLHRVALNLCYDKLRSASSRHEEAIEELPEHPDAASGPEAQLGQSERCKQVGEALSRLPPRQREALVLHYYQELSQADTAALMGISVDALESLLARARRRLRSELLGARTTFLHFDVAP